MSSLLLPVGDTPQSLRSAVRAACDRDYRRVNRFIELSLLGAANFRQSNLPSSTSLMLSSDTGMWAETATVIEGMVAAARVPKPFEFMNLSGSMAGFHVAELLGLQGPQLGLQKNYGCFESALPLVLAGASSQCIVGVVEEACWPVETMRERIDWPDGDLCECSHWVHFDQDCEQPIGEIEIFPIMRSRGEVEARLAASGTPRSWISVSAFSRSLSAKEDWPSLANQFQVFEPGPARLSCGLTLEILCRFAEIHSGETLIHVNQTAEQEFHVLKLSVAATQRPPQIAFSIS